MFPIPKKALGALWVTILICFNGFCQTTGFSQTGNNIDVTYYRCNWRINPDSTIKAIGGSVTMYFVTKANNVNRIKLDLNATFSVSAAYHGASITVTKPLTNIIELQLPAALPIETFDSVTIFYNGTPPPVDDQAEGFQRKNLTFGSGSSGNFIYTLSESFEDRDWWPCKADMQDKPDSMDFHVSVPNGFRVAAPGKFIDSSLQGSSRIFIYKTRLPIATYLVALGVAKYRVMDRGTVNIGGTNVPVWYFILPGKTSSRYTSIRNALDFSTLELQAFSSKFGDYPFKEEKHGYYEFGWSGGMEHQSFSAMGDGSLTSWGVIAHELMHQWFGDKVTFATWQHLWLAEGFARYGEVLAAELVPSLGHDPVSLLDEIKTAATGTTLNSYSVLIPPAYITSSNALWTSRYGSTVYERGAMVVSMLRALVGDDKFFEACRNYLNDPLLSYRSAVTADLIRHFNTAAGRDLTPFFDSWVTKSGNATYNIQWGYNSGSKRIVLKVGSQTKNGSGNPAYFYTPVVVKVSGAGGKDTTLVFYDQNGTLSRAGNSVTGDYNNQTGVSFPISFAPLSVAVDPDHRTMINGTASLVAVLPGEILSFQAKALAQGNELRLELQRDLNVEEVRWQKSSNGADFTDAGKMQLLDTEVYRAADTDPYPVTWYRAKIITEGKVILSKIERLAIKTKQVLTVTPNPAGRIVKVKSSTPMNGMLQLLNAEGKAVISKSVSASEIELQTSMLPAGVYALQLNVQGSIVSTQRIVIQR